MIHLLLSGYLKEDFHSTAYAINVYLLSGPQAMRLTRLSREAIEAGTGHIIECAFLKKPTRKSKGQSDTKGKGSGTGTKSSKISSGSASLSSNLPPLSNKSKSSRSGQNSVQNEKSRKKRKRRRSDSDDGESVSEVGNEEEEEEEEVPGEFDDFIVDDEGDGIDFSPTNAQKYREADAGLRHLSPSIFVSSDHEPIDDEEDDWTFSMRPNKRLRTNAPVVSNNEIVILSD